MTGVDDAYTIPGSHGVLRNKLGISDKARLDAAMNDHASTEWAGMGAEVPATITFDYLARIHRRFFGELFEWAGQIRTTPTVAGNTGMPHALPKFITSELDNAFAILGANDGLRGLNSEAFTVQLADGWGYLTQVHPFRDGNTRSQTAMIDRLAYRAGHPIAWADMDVMTLSQLRHTAVARPLGLAEYLHAHLLTKPATAEEHEANRLAAAVREANRHEITYGSTAETNSRGLGY